MNLFVIAALILTALAVVTVIRPLLRKTGDVPAAPVAAVVLGLALPAAVLAEAADTVLASSPIRAPLAADSVLRWAHCCWHGSRLAVVAVEMANCIA